MMYYTIAQKKKFLKQLLFAGVVALFMKALLGFSFSLSTHICQGTVRSSGDTHDSGKLQSCDENLVINRQ